MNQISYINSEISSDRQTYTVKEIAQILGLSERTAYHHCSTTKHFKVLKVGRCVRVHKESFDKWFYNY